MKILDLKNSDKPNGVKIIGLMGSAEFKQLVGELDNLCVFATKTISEPASFTKTGAKHRHAKYLLFPVKLRRQFNMDEYDFENLTCGCLEYKDKVFVIYGVGRKDITTHLKERNDSLEL